MSFTEEQIAEAVRIARGGTAQKTNSFNGAHARNSEIDLGAVFSFLGDEPAKPPQELIRGLLPAHGVVITGGQSTAGKTFVEIHKSICLAASLPFFGHPVVERVGTVFVAAEGRNLINNRFEAARVKAGIEGSLPISWIKLLPDLSSADGMKLFARQLKAMDERYRGDFGVRLGRFVIDTVAATFSMKDEDDNAEASKVCKLLRCLYEKPAHSRMRCITTAKIPRADCAVPAHGREALMWSWAYSPILIH
jgi:hypothetical protein